VTADDAQGPVPPRVHPGDAFRVGEYAATAKHWRAFVREPKALEDVPLAVLLLHALAPEGMTGDLLLDVLGAVTDTIAGWRALGRWGGTDVVQIEVDDLRLAERRGRVAAELLRRDRLMREQK
jgi:hypothetical protein